MRSPWCAFAYEQHSSRRVKVTVLAGAFVRFAAFELPGVSTAFLGARALSRLKASTLFKSPAAGLVHNGTSCCFDCVQLSAYKYKEARFGCFDCVQVNNHA